jgi:hypothetical protein
MLKLICDKWMGALETHRGVVGYQLPVTGCKVQVSG